MTEDGAMEVWRLAHNADKPMKLHDAALALGYATSRGVASLINAAWKWLVSSKHDAKAAEIARTFVDKDGNFPWKGKK